MATDKLLVYMILLLACMAAFAVDQRQMLSNSNHEIKVQQEEIDGLRKDLGACQGFMRGN